MKNYLISTLFVLLTTGCIAISVDSEINMEHDYTFTSESSVTSSAQECYMPSFAHQLSKMDHKYKGLSWKISSFKDEIDLSSNSGINQLTLTVFNGDDVVTLKDNTVDKGAVILEADAESLLKLKSILATETAQICLSVTGNISTPMTVHDKISFQVDMDYTL